MVAISVPPAEAPVVSIQHVHRAAAVLRAAAYVSRCGREADEALATALCLLARSLEHAEPVAVMAPDPRVDTALDRLGDLQALLSGIVRDTAALVGELVALDARTAADGVDHVRRVAALAERLVAETAGRLS